MKDEEPLFCMGALKVVKHSGVVYVHVPKYAAQVWDLMPGDILDLACLRVWRVARRPKGLRENPDRLSGTS